jgi:hypothetical protein
MHSMPPLVNLHIDGPCTPYGYDRDDVFGEDIGPLAGGKRKGVEDSLSARQEGVPDLAQIHASLWFTMADREEEKFKDVAQVDSLGKKMPYEGFLSLDPVFNSNLHAGVKGEITTILKKVVKLEGDASSPSTSKGVFTTYLKVTNPSGDNTPTRELRAVIGRESEFSLGLDDLPKFKNMILTRVLFASGALDIEESASVALQPYPIVPSSALGKFHYVDYPPGLPPPQLIQEHKRHGTIHSGALEFRNAQLKRMADVPGCSFFLYSDMVDGERISPQDMQEAVGRIGSKIYRQLLQYLQTQMFASKLNELKGLSELRWDIPTERALKRVEDQNAGDMSESQEDEESTLGEPNKIPTPDQIDEWLDWKASEEKRQRDTEILEGRNSFPPEFFLEPSEVGADEHGQVMSMTAYPSNSSISGLKAPYATNTTAVETDRMEDATYAGLASIYYCADYVKKTIHSGYRFEAPTLERSAPMVRLKAAAPNAPIRTVYSIGLPSDTILQSEVTRATNVRYAPPEYALNGDVIRIEDISSIHAQGSPDPEVKYGVIQRVWKLRNLSYEWLFAQLQSGAPLRVRLESQNRTIGGYRTCFHVDGIFAGHFMGFDGDSIKFKDACNLSESEGFTSATRTSTIQVVMN